MTTYGQVRSWQAEVLNDAVALLGSGFDELQQARDDLATGGRPAIWWSPAALVADGRRIELTGRMDGLTSTVDTVRRAAAGAADTVAALHRLADETEELARAHGFRLTDDGSVVDLDPDADTEDADGRERIRADLRGRVALVTRGGDELDTTLLEAITTAIAVMARGPGGEELSIPDPPPPPPPDEGAGEHDSDPWWSTGDDRAKKEAAYLAASVADAMGLTNAAQHLRHYLGNSGDDLRVDPDRIGRDVPTFQQSVDWTTSDQIRQIADEAAANGTYGQPTQFTTDWTDYYVHKDESQDWFYAMGGLHYSVTGVATVHPPDTPGGQPTVEVDYQVHVTDRYNWDEGKKVEIGPVTIHDEQMAEMHRAGVAQEYDMAGSSDTRHYAGEVPPASGDSVLPQPPDNRDGTRTDPGR